MPVSRRSLLIAAVLLCITGALFGIWRGGQHETTAVAAYGFSSSEKTFEQQSFSPLFAVSGAWTYTAFSNVLLPGLLQEQSPPAVPEQPLVAEGKKKANALNALRNDALPAAAVHSRNARELAQACFSGNSARQDKKKLPAAFSKELGSHISPPPGTRPPAYDSEQPCLFLSDFRKTSGKRPNDPRADPAQQPEKPQTAIL